MASFKVGEHEWHLHLPYGVMQRIKRETGIDLTKALTDGEKFAEVLFLDSEAFFKCLWIACESQAEKAGVDFEAFCSPFDGDAIDNATTALLNAIVDFLPKAKGRDEMRRNLSRLMQTSETAVSAAIAKQMETCLNSVANSPESAGSIPTPALSANS